MLPELLSFCSILLHDRISLDPNETREAENLTEIFIRNSLKVPSTNRVRQYFEEELVGN